MVCNKKFHGPFFLLTCRMLAKNGELAITDSFFVGYLLKMLSKPHSTKEAIGLQVSIYCLPSAQDAQKSRAGYPPVSG